MAANNNDPRFLFTPVPPHDKNNWAPRSGFNYRLTERAVLRGGYSRTYDLIFNNICLNIFSAFPFTQVNNLPARTPGSFQYVYSPGFQGVIPPPPSPLQARRTIVSAGFRAPLAEQFSFQDQREVARDWTATAGFVATKGTAPFQTLDGNPTVPESQGRQRLFANQGVRRLRVNAANSIYHSLQSSLEKRLSNNFSIAAHYPWSTFIDLASEIFSPSVSGEAAAPQDIYNRSAEPGFRLSGIDALVGNAIRPGVATDLDLSRMTLRKILQAGGRTLFWQAAAASPVGNAGRNILSADGIHNLDLARMKKVRISESNMLQYRCEFENRSNTRNNGIPESRLNSTVLGLEGNTGGGNRRIVMDLRYTFQGPIPCPAHSPRSAAMCGGALSLKDWSENE